MADVLQLAHITGETELRQTLQGGLRNALGLYPQLLGAALQEMLGQHGHVLGTLAQRGQTQPDHIQAVEQVFTEHPILDPLLQVLVGGSNHADIAFDRRMATNPVELPIRQHAQQPGLQIEGHVTDFVQEQGPALRLLETPSALRLRPGEGATLMAEQLRLQQILGNGGGVDGHERAVCDRRVLVQGTRHQFLARTGFAGDQHGDGTLAEATDRPEHILHRGRLAQHFGHGRLAFLCDLLALTFFHRATNQLHRLGQIERLGQVLERAALEGRHRTVQVRIGGHDDDRQFRLLRMHLLQQLQARAARHADIADQDTRALVCGIAFRQIGQGGQHFAGVAEAAGVQVFASQRLF